MKHLFPKNIRLRLALANALAMAVVMALLGGFLFLILRHNAYAELDIKLRNDLEAADDALPGVLRTPGSSLTHDPENWLTEVWSRSGERIVSTGAPEELPLGPFDRVCLGSGSFDVTPEKGVPLRVFCQESSSESGAFFLRVARGRQRIEAQLGQFLVAAAVAMPTAAILSLILGYLLARHALSPVSRLTDAARRISVSRLGDRLPVEHRGDELGRLAVTFNQVFDGLEQSFRQMRRFTADASHELRTPLTAIRAIGEVALRQHQSTEGQDPSNRRDLADTVSNILEEAGRLQSLCESLLLLSRADSGQVALRLEIVSVPKLLQDVAELLEILADEKGQKITVDATPEHSGRFDPLLIKQVLTNLIDNAIKYCPPKATIGLSSALVNGRLVLSIVDDGPGIAKEHLPHIFERFYRVDKARSRNAGEGVGLGLAIVAWAVELHGGRIAVASETGRGCRFTVEIPQHEAGDHADGTVNS